MKNTRKRRLMSATAAAMVALMPVTLAPASTAQPAAEEDPEGIRAHGRSHRHPGRR